MEPPQENHFAMKFTPYMYAISKTIILGKKSYVVPFQLAAKNNRFLLRVFPILAKFEKKKQTNKQTNTPTNKQTKKLSQGIFREK